MELSVRPLDLAGDTSAFRSIISRVYGNGDPYEIEDRGYHVTRYEARADDAVVGAYSILALNTVRDRRIIPCGGIAGVAIPPEHRASGIGTRMMQAAVRRMREDGIPISSLYPYREMFYRRAGYETAGGRLKITVATDRFPRIDSAERVYTLKPDDWERLNPCYSAFAMRYSGLSLRDASMWRRVLAENRDLTIYAVGDPVRAYAVVSHKVDFWTADHISEFIWDDLDAYQTMIGFFRGLAVNKNSLSWWEPTDSPYLARFLDQGVSATFDRMVMWRVNDVPAALTSLRPPGSGKFTLAIEDDVVPENNGPWRVEYGPEGVAVYPTDGEPDVTFGIRPFAQVFMGEPSVIDMLRWGALTVDRETEFHLMNLFPATPTYLPEFF